MGKLESAWRRSQIVVGGRKALLTSCLPSSQWKNQESVPILRKGTAPGSGGCVKQPRIGPASLASQC